MTTTLPASAGDKLQAEDVNRFSGIISATAGETINGATLPVACYFDDTTNEWYACDGNDTAKLKFSGFAISNGTDGNTIKIQAYGVVSGFSGLTIGADYYIQDDKTIGTTPGTYQLKVGVALSATELLVQRGKLVAGGALTGVVTAAAGNNDEVVTCGFRPRKIILYYFIQGHSPSSGTGQYLGIKGMAEFIKTTYTTGMEFWNTPDVAGDGLTGDNGTPNDVPEAIKNASKVGATLTVGSAGAGDEDISMTISINAISETGFTVRMLTAIGAGDNSSNARAVISWVALE